MKRNIIYCLFYLLSFTSICFGGDKVEKVIIIKADDIRGITQKWDRFFNISKEKGVKVSAGIICNSLSKPKKEYQEWLLKLKDSGQVEFWNHGWDHKRWQDKAGKQIKEFSSSGYQHQKKHFSDSQNAMKRILGTAPTAFGPPYNAIDDDTIKVMNEDEDMKLLFSYRNNSKLKDKVIAPMKLRGENDGTGKPNFEKFKANYMKKKNLSFSAVQFHPNGFKENHFAEYAKIIDFLIDEGWTFMLPSEYMAMKKKSD